MTSTTTKPVGRLAALIVTLLISGGVASSALAFKPGKPSKPKVYTDASGKYVATLKPTKGFAGKVTVVTPSERFTWKSTTAIPAKGLVAPKTGHVVLMGGYGNPGVDLGKVAVYDFKGRLVHSIDLRKRLKNLEKLSEKYRRICCPFPWIHAASLAKSGTELRINVCDKRRVAIDLKSGRVLVRKAR